MIPPGEIKDIKHNFEIRLVSSPNYFMLFDESVDPPHHTLPLGFGGVADTQCASHDFGLNLDLMIHKSDLRVDFAWHFLPDKLKAKIPPFACLWLVTLSPSLL